MTKSNQTKSALPHFSERAGLVPVRKLMRNEVTEELRNVIWNALRHTYWSDGNVKPLELGLTRVQFQNPDPYAFWRFFDTFWTIHLKRSVDSRGMLQINNLNSLRRYFEECEWFKFFDLLEFILDYYFAVSTDDDLTSMINKCLVQEASAYRVVNRRITEITDEIEIAELESVFLADEVPLVRAHLTRALELLSDRQNPDFRNSIKESISAVESLAKEISGKKKASLGDALKEIEKTQPLHAALKESFLKLYGYTSDSDGIRHALMSESNLSHDDAKYVLLSCTSFINYLKSKMAWKDKK